MADTVLDVQGLFKKFRRGELYTSLRDLIPGLTRRLARREGPGQLEQRDFWALQDVSFSIQRGEAFGIIGGNGAGKSTILKLLTGIMRPTSGSIRVAGRISALIEVSAGFHPDLTGRENIYLNGAILGMKRDEIRRRFDAIVEFSGLEEFVDTPVKRYSSGMYARLGFSVAAHVPRRAAGRRGAERRRLPVPAQVRRAHELGDRERRHRRLRLAQPPRGREPLPAQPPAREGPGPADRPDRRGDPDLLQPEPGAACDRRRDGRGAHPRHDARRRRAPNPGCCPAPRAHAPRSSS